MKQNTSLYRYLPLNIKQARIQKIFLRRGGVKTFDLKFQKKKKGRGQFWGELSHIYYVTICLYVLLISTLCQNALEDVESIWTMHGLGILKKICKIVER